LTVAVAIPQIPALRWGAAYASLEQADVKDFRTGEVIARVGQVNAGLIRRDLRRAGEAAAKLRELSCEAIVALCAKAGDLFMSGDLMIGDMTQSPQQYVKTLSRTSGLPHELCWRNMRKIHTVLTTMGAIVRGLTRGLHPSIIDSGTGTQDGVPVSFVAQTDALGVVLPSNSPGVNSIWLPALALRTPVVLKPGRDEPWTPLRLTAALVAAGLPPEAIAFYPTDHEGADTIIRECGRSILFGDDKTIARYADNPAVEVHGTGRSKVVLGADEADRWQTHLDMLVASVADNGGRSCINASCIVVPPGYGDAVADAVAARLAAVTPRPAGDPEARLAAFTNAAVAQAIDARITADLAAPGCEDITARHRPGPRLVCDDGATYLLPTLVRCASIDHPLANTEFLFPYASVVELPQHEVLSRIGPTLVASVVSGDPGFIADALRCRHIDRLNLGPLPTSHVEWDQPHEGNLFDFLYRRRAIQRA
jgi:acyl-CoA reductase-like NAD-dependent aldehyde dehydrogenase